jgi:gas vesicle structural protein
MATTGSAITRAPRPSSLADVLDLILDKGLVIDAYVRISAVGIEVLTIDARIVIASVDTYLHYAEAVNRLDLTQTETQGITGLFGGNSDQDSESSNGNGGGHESRSRSSNGSSRSRSSGRRLARGSAGPSDDDQDDQDADDEDGRGRSLARRIGEKGRWNQ